jgi:serine/threonine protein kinase
MESNNGLVRTIFQRFYERPENLPAQNYGFFVFTNYAYFWALIAHASFICLFAYLGKTNLAIFNIASCLLFVAAIKFNLRGHLITGFALAAFEVISHAIFCVLILGWGSGFHFYILGVMLTFFVAPLKKVTYKIILAGILSLIYIALFYYAKVMPPLSPVTVFMQNFFNVSNFLVFNLVISFALYASYEGIMRAEAKLARAIDQLKLSQEETQRKNQALAKKNEELIELHQRANRIFSALAGALPGTLLDGKYHLGERIGAGGFGAVYKATHVAMKREVAVKIFRPQAGNDSAENLARFQLEAVSASRLNHPNVVQVLDSGISSDGFAYMVMELLSGHSLSRELSLHKPLTPARSVEIILPVCDLLAKAHTIGIIHRDIKPDNIFLHQSEEGEIVKVVDFGIAKFEDDSLTLEEKNLTGQGNIIGTPTYMAPERFEMKEYDGKADVYSIGVMLHEMLIGQPPFKAIDGNFVSLIRQHLSTLPPRLNEIDKSIPEKLATVVLKALEKNPANRCAARELAQELAASLNIDLNKPLTTSKRILTSVQGGNENITQKLNVVRTNETKL